MPPDLDRVFAPQQSLSAPFDSEDEEEDPDDNDEQDMAAGSGGALPCVGKCGLFGSEDKGGYCSVCYANMNRRKQRIANREKSKQSVLV